MCHPMCLGKPTPVWKFCMLMLHVRALVFKHPFDICQYFCKGESSQHVGSSVRPKIQRVVMHYTVRRYGLGQIFGQEYDRSVLLSMWIMVAKYLNPNLEDVILAQDALAVESLFETHVFGEEATKSFEVSKLSLFHTTLVTTNAYV